MAPATKRKRSPKNTEDEAPPKEYVEVEDAEGFERNETTVHAEVGRVGITLGERVENWKGDYKPIKPMTDAERLNRLQELEPDDIVIDPAPGGHDYATKPEDKVSDLGMILPEYD